MTKRAYMVREIIKPVSEVYNLHIPKEYINKRVEILILPFSYNENDKNIEQNDDVLKNFRYFKKYKYRPFKMARRNKR